MATFPDLRSFDHFATETTDSVLTLPIGGREYTWHAKKISLRAMLTMQRVEAETRRLAAKVAAGEKIDQNVVVMDDVEEQQFGDDLVGVDKLERMAADGVLWSEVQHVMATLMAWYLQGEQAAHAIWTGGREAKPADPPARAASTKTAGSSTTRPRNPRSGGRKSSGTGRSSKRTSTANTTST